MAPPPKTSQLLLLTLALASFVALASSYPAGGFPQQQPNPNIPDVTSPGFFATITNWIHGGGAPRSTGGSGGSVGNVGVFRGGGGGSGSEGGRGKGFSGGGWGMGGVGPDGKGFGKRGVSPPSTVCGDGPCKGKSLTCPSSCFSSYSYTTEHGGGGGGGGGCSFDCNTCQAKC